MKKIGLLLFAMVSLATNAQVLIDDTTPANSAPESSAVLELNSETRGFLLPRLDAAPANPVDGLIYFDNQQNCLRLYKNVSEGWVDVTTCDAILGSVFEQNFDDLTTWSYTPSPAPYNVSGDIWDIVASLSNFSFDNNFWGMQDLNNNNGGGTFLHTLKFQSIDLTNANGATLSFDYESTGMNTTGDRYGYELFYDGVSQGQVDLCLACNQTIRDQSVTATIPNSVGSFY